MEKGMWRQENGGNSGKGQGIGGDCGEMDVGGFEGRGQRGRDAESGKWRELWGKECGEGVEGRGHRGLGMWRQGSGGNRGERDVGKGTWAEDCGERDVETEMRRELWGKGCGEGHTGSD